MQKDSVELQNVGNSKNGDIVIIMINSVTLSM